MFGGWGFSCDGVSVGVMADGVLYLKVDATNRAEFEEAGGKPFTYYPGDGRKFMQMSYWTVPDEAVESPALMAPWARSALQAALRQANAKPVRKTANKLKAKQAASADLTAQPATKKIATKRPTPKAAPPKGPRA